MRLVAAEPSLLPYWGDLHGQSEETIGTNSARDFHAFARDRAFLDAVSHQGNDFQITTAFWADLNELTAEFNEDGRFVAFPGYEWSGNTGLGGDRNVLFMNEGRQIHRSSHALVDDLSDLDSGRQLGRGAVRRPSRTRTASSSPTSAGATPTSRWPTTSAWSGPSRCTRPGAPSSG